ncbi:hypothetical protein F5883DRAFT_652703 [Diaporthe sp. PMI_573]|jgi:hypothetical protein|nr:hypothetical protein F5883DRAFT_652703 [Diaporthaceae sp. PMI_573]
MPFDQNRQHRGNNPFPGNNRRERGYGNISYPQQPISRPPIPSATPQQWQMTPYYPTQFLDPQFNRLRSADQGHVETDSIPSSISFHSPKPEDGFENSQGKE